jgi:hypothetical protein
MNTIEPVISRKGRRAPLVVSSLLFAPGYVSILRRHGNALRVRGFGGEPEGCPPGRRTLRSPVCLRYASSATAHPLSVYTLLLNCRRVTDISAFKHLKLLGSYIIL